jgi:hypothetical protein
MSSNRLLYDDCAKNQQEIIDKSQLNWVLDKNRHIHDNNCMIDSGIMAGNIINNNKFSNRVDLEGKLFGLGNLDSKCKGPLSVEYEPHNMDNCNFFNIDGEHTQNNNTELVNNKCK